MPFDWLVSRVEGVLYFFRHGFRDFTHYDDAQAVENWSPEPKTLMKPQLLASEFRGVSPCPRLSKVP